MRKLFVLNDSVISDLIFLMVKITDIKVLAQFLKQVDVIDKREKDRNECDEPQNIRSVEILLNFIQHQSLIVLILNLVFFLCCYKSCLRFVNVIS